jgi:hypothetical protein
MAYNPQYKMSIQDASGNYYYATLNEDASWTVDTTPTLTYIQVLPDNWQEMQVEWERDMETMGIWRSSSENGSYKFSMDGRTIIQEIRSTQGVAGYGLLTIWMINSADFNYNVFYPSELDFTTYHDYQQFFYTEIQTLDSGLHRDYTAYSDTVYNIPIWKNTGTVLAPVWVPYNNNAWILHNGLKLMYNSTFLSAASGDAPGLAVLYELFGFNHGRHATSGPDMGVHTIPNMAVYAPVQNNGATTWIGNTIMDPFLKTGNQNPGSAQIANELNFSGINNSQPWTRENYSMKNYCQPPYNTIQMLMACSGQWISDPIAYCDNGNGCFIGIVLFEIDPTDTPAEIGGLYQYQLLYKLEMPGAYGVGTPAALYTPPSPTFSTYANPVPVTINPNMAYVLGIIFDEDHTPGGLSGDGSKVCFMGFAGLQFSILSYTEMGVLGGAIPTPLPAPRLNPSVFAGYRLHQLFEMIAPFLGTIETDLNGFPVANPDAPYTGRSDALSDATYNAGGDCIPWNIIITSAFCIHSLEGQSYVSLSLNQFYSFLKKQVGFGMSIEADPVTGNQTVLRCEPYSYYFPDCTNPANMILDLGFSVTNFEIEQAGPELGIGCNLKLGYQDDSDTLNSNFGADCFNGEEYFDLPIPQIPGVMDFEEDDFLTEQTAIEIARAQQVSQPVGSSYNPANPTTDNQAIALYCNPISIPGYSAEQVIDPSNNIIPSVTVWPVTQYDGVLNPQAQSVDPTATTIALPYINNLNFPDTAVNINLSPGRALLRGVGAFLHSILDKLDAFSMVFRNTSVMQYNNVALGLSGISTNLEVGAGETPLTEFQDVPIATLPPKLFLPVKCTITTSLPFNFYQILAAKPNGYIQFNWQNEGFGYKTYKFYPNKVVQTAQGKTSVLTGFFTPDQVI